MFLLEATGQRKDPDLAGPTARQIRLGTQPTCHVCLLHHCCTQCDDWKLQESVRLAGQVQVLVDYDTRWGAGLQHLHQSHWRQGCTTLDEAVAAGDSLRWQGLVASIENATELGVPEVSSLVGLRLSGWRCGNGPPRFRGRLLVGLHAG